MKILRILHTLAIMEIDLLLSFLGASFLFIIMPGPDSILVLTESITKGQKNGTALSIGLSLGLLVHTTAAATGLSIIIQNSALAFQLVKYLGAIYLFYLAIQTFKEKAEKPVVNNSIVETNFYKLIRKGILANILNPKVSLFFMAFLPQFVSPHGFHITLQMIFLGLLFMIQSLIIFSIVASLSGNLNQLVNNSRFWKITKWGKITVLSTMSILLATSKK